MSEKKYYWLKLKADFFDEKYIRALRRLPQGDSLVIVYLKMQLKSLKTEGLLQYEHILPDAISELALLLDEDETIVQLAVNALIKFGVVERWENGDLYFVAMQQLIGSETSVAARVRKHRELKETVVKQKTQLPAKSNAERQRTFRAKKACEEVQHVPFIEDYINLKRYGGNYYLVMKRDKFKCAICGSIENLCVHHIDGYDENKPENNKENKMLVLCRACHSQVHAGTVIPNSILESIDYFDDNVTLHGNTLVTNCNTDIDKELEIELEQDIENREDKKWDNGGTMSRQNENEQKSKIIIEIVDYLNAICGTSYKASTDKTRKLINARLNEGFTVDDFKTVIDKKSKEWLGTDYAKYLRPETLFGTKFESYLNALNSHTAYNGGKANTMDMLESLYCKYEDEENETNSNKY